MTFDFDTRQPLRSSWNTAGLLRGKPLTDKKISKYERMGFYNLAFREARRELMARKAARQREREGNFLKGSDGNLVYSPR